MGRRFACCKIMFRYMIIMKIYKQYEGQEELPTSKNGAAKIMCRRYSKNHIPIIVRAGAQHLILVLND